MDDHDALSYLALLVRVPGPSARQLARDSGGTLSHATISRIATGYRGVSYETVRALAEVMGFDLRLVRRKR